MTSIYRTILLVVLLLSYGFQFAGIEESTARLNNPINSSQSLIVIDHQYVAISQYDNAGEFFHNHQIDDVISVGIMEESQSLIEDANITLQVEYTGYDGANIPQAPVVVELHLFYENGMKVEALNSFEFQGFLKFSCRILAIYDVNNVQLTTWPEGIYLEAITRVDRVYKFDPNYVLDEYGQIEVYSDDGDNVADELLVSWNFIPGAEFYELEWTFVNDYDSRDPLSSQIEYLDASDISFGSQNFRLNSTRIQTANNHYKIPLIYEHGYIIYRIRGVGRGNEAFEHIEKLNFGSWSDNIQSLAGTQNLSVWINNYAGVYAYLGFQTNLNWEYSATYAERGMRKDVLAYFDGLLRSRQVVTKLNSNEISVVGESFYDASGRSAVTVLPAPSGFHHLNYHENFSLNHQDEPYSYFDFDFSSTNCGTLDPAAMSTTSGASHYYGPSLLSNNSHDFVPDAHQYPFSAVQYMNDGSGRIKASSMPGITHKLGSGHETKYLYSVPAQEELDRLFGSNVGYCSNYRKHMVIDPNGQVSVTYLDLAGNTIATALAGGNPSNLEPLMDNDAEQPLLITSSNNLNLAILDDAQVTPNPLTMDNNTLAISGDNGAAQPDELLSNTSRSVAVMGETHSFEYSLRFENSEENNPVELFFDHPCLNGENVVNPINYEFSYLLQLNDMGCEELFTSPESLFSGVPVVINEWNAQSTGDLVDNTYGLTGYTLAEDNTSVSDLEIRTYNIAKSLKVNPEAVDYLAARFYDDVLTAASTDPQCQNIINLQSFIESRVLTNAEESDCDFTCTDCVAEIVLYFGDCYENLSSEDQQAWIDMYEECMEPCTNLSNCDLIREMLLADMSPGGQYAMQNTQDALSYLNENCKIRSILRFLNENEAALFVWQKSDLVFHSTDEFGELEETRFYNYEEGMFSGAPNLDEDGVPYMRVNQISNAAYFVNEWQPSWAETLLPFHPEYAYLNWWCGMMENRIDATSHLSSDQFDAILMATTSQTAASSVDLSNNFCNEILEGTFSPGDNFTPPFYFLNPDFAAVIPMDLSTIEQIVGNDPFFNVTDFSGDYEYTAVPYVEMDGQSAALTSFDETRFMQECVVPYAVMIYDEIPEIPAVNYIKNKFLERINNYVVTPSGTLNLLEFAALREICPSWYGNDFGQCASDIIGINLVTTNLLTDSQKSEVWKYFTMSYVQEKNQMMLGLAHQGGINWGCYNDCFGNGGFSPPNQWFSHHDVQYLDSDLARNHYNMRYTYEGGFEYPNQPIIFYPGQPCNMWDHMLFDWYDAKTARFPKPISQSALHPSTSTLGANVLQNDALLYQNTGACPIVLTFQGFLQNIIQDKYYIGNTQYHRLVAAGGGSLGYPMHEAQYWDYDFYTQIAAASNASFVAGYEIEGNIVNYTAGNYIETYLNTSVTSNLCSINFSAAGASMNITLDVPLSNLSWSTYGTDWEFESVSNIAVTSASPTPTVNTPVTFSGIGVIRYLVAINGSIPQNSYVILTGSTTFNLYCNTAALAAEIASQPISENCGQPILTELEALLNLYIPEYGTNYDYDPISMGGEFGALCTYLQNGNSNAHIFIENSGGSIQISSDDGIPGTEDRKLMIGGIGDISAWDHIESFTLLGDGVTADLIVASHNSLNLSSEYSTVQVSLSFFEGTVPTDPNPLSECSVDEYILTAYDAWRIYKWIMLHMPYPSPDSILNTTHDASSDEFLASLGISYVITSRQANPHVNWFAAFYDADSQELFTSWGNIYHSIALWPEFTGEHCPIYPLEVFSSHIMTTTQSTIQHVFEDLNPLYPFVYVDPNAIFSVVQVQRNIPVVCIPNQVPPKPCSSVYQEYLSMAESYYPADLDVLELCEFCSCDQSEPTATISNETIGMQYIGLEYVEYLDLFNVNSIENNPYYVSIYDFGSIGAKHYYEAYYGYAVTLSNLLDVDFEAVSNEELFINLQEFIEANLSTHSVTDYFEHLEALLLQNTNAILPTIVEWVADPNTVLIPPCFNPDPFLTPFIPVSNLCESLNQDLAIYNTQNILEQEIQGLVNNFVQDYITQALEAVVEDFSMSVPDQEYYYTLYYYDQAKNLVRTVPPSGVHQFSGDTSEGLSEIQMVQEDRQLNVEYVDRLHEKHSLFTTYKYNVLNQLTHQESPDGGLTRFWYDKLGRMIASQNARQVALNEYSYTKYDYLSRPIEAGVCMLPAEPTPTMLNDVDFPNPFSMMRYEVVHTFYDQYAFDLPSAPPSQANIRNRIAHVAYYEDFVTGANELDQEYDYATHYIYDIHGNVHTLIQENGYIHSSERYKRMDYDYDLISGRVNEVIYQPDAIDQFIHRYAYDPDNRISNVFTSKDGVIWEQDAKYFYYDHGPLARTEIGERKVQGIDHAYTINGWLKGVNSNMLTASSDIGKDGKEANINGLIAKDEFGYTLGYFEGDYAPRTAAELLPSNNFLLNHHYERSLYNGNITHMSTSIAAFMFGVGDEAEPSTFEYKYDQLNRIIEARHRDWTTGNVPGLADHKWLTSYDFDLNGNILHLKRNDSQGDQFDDLEYHYAYKLDDDAINNSGVVSMEENNRLLHVHDAEANTIDTDITDQDPFNYGYDNIGNLIADQKEQIENIEWTVTGKIKSITRTTNSDLPDLAFLYDPMGQRIAKIVKDRTGGTPSERNHWRTTWYVRDASGNVMSTYEEETIENNEAECPAGTYDYTTTIVWSEAHIYGSSRVGMETQSAITSRFGVNYDSNDEPTYAAANCITFEATDVYSQVYGDKRYELTNHLGNVLVVVSDRLIANTGASLSYSSEVISATDYYPYGMVMDDRNYQQVVSEGYRYGYQNQEEDRELWEGAVSYKYRVEDPRLGRFFSVDPLAAKYPHNSVYAFSENQVIHMIELEGLESTVPERLKPTEVEEPTILTDPVPDPDWLNVDQVPFNPPLNLGFENTLHKRFEPSFSSDMMPEIEEQVNKVFKDPKLIEIPVNKVVRDLADKISGLDYTLLQDTEGEYSNTATLTQLQVTVTKITVTENSGPFSVNETYPEDHEDPMRQFFIQAPTNGAVINIDKGDVGKWKIQISMKIMVEPPFM